MTGLKDKLEQIRRSGLGDKSHPEYIFDRSILTSRDPLTQAEIDYINLQITDAVRKLATEYGCEPQDVEKIEAHYWYGKEGHDYRDNEHIWGVFYDCTQSNHEQKGRGDDELPSKVRWFMDEFGRGLQGIVHSEGNVELQEDGSRHTIGYTPGYFTNAYAAVRGKSQQVLLPTVKLLELLDPTFQLHFDVPQRYESAYDKIGDAQLQTIAEADPSAFWLDPQWAEEELARREQGRLWSEMQKRLDRSRAGAKEASQPQPLGTRLGIALRSERVQSTDRDAPYGSDRNR